MSDLISRQAAIDALIAGEPYGIEYNINKIRELPPAQAEIVRCVDCKFYSRCTDHQGICTNRYMDGFIVPDWFCADGEVRDDDI